MEQQRKGPALHIARRALDAEMRDRTDGLEAADLLFERLGSHLGQWLDLDGWQTVLKRAFAEASVADPRLTQVALDESYRLCWVSSEPSTVPLGPETFATLLAAVIEVLGRIVGSDLAVHLVELGLPEKDDV